jgi:hypothetical protein
MAIGTRHAQAIAPSVTLRASARAFKARSITLRAAAPAYDARAGIASRTTAIQHQPRPYHSAEHHAPSSSKGIQSEGRHRVTRDGDRHPPHPSDSAEHHASSSSEGIIHRGRHGVMHDCDRHQPRSSNSAEHHAPSSSKSIESEGRLRASRTMAIQHQPHSNDSAEHHAPSISKGIQSEGRHGVMHDGDQHHAQAIEPSITLRASARAYTTRGQARRHARWRSAHATPKR